MTHSFMVPYRTAFVPLQLVPTIPPILADGPGSTGKKRPECLICSFKSIQDTAGWTMTSMSSSCNWTILSMNIKSTLIPPCGAEKFASRLEPPEYGIIGTRYLWHILAICETSSVDFGYATATGNWSTLIEDHSENPCTRRSSSSVLMVSSPSVSRK